jgi:hypothetical protein
MAPGRCSCLERKGTDAANLCSSRRRERPTLSAAALFSTTAWMAVKSSFKVSFPCPAVCRGLRGELACLDEVNEGGPGHLDDLGDRRLGHFLLQQQLDFRLLTVELGLAQRSFRAAEQSALGSGGSETLFGPFGDQVPLDFGEQTRAPCGGHIMSDTAPPDTLLPAAPRTPHIYIAGLGLQTVTQITREVQDARRIIAPG